MLNHLFPFKKKLSSLPTALCMSVFLTGLCATGFSVDEPPVYENSSTTKKNKESDSIFRDTKPILEGKVGYFFFTNSKMRKVYDKGGFDAQITGTYPIWKGLEVYGSVEYLERNGLSLNDKQKTSLYQIPVNIGLRPVFTICNEIQYYATFGPRYFYIHQHNDSSYVPKSRGRSGVGFFVNTGFNLIPMEHFVIDVFGEYSWAKTHFHNSSDNVYGTSIQIGGFTFGAGLGYAF